MLVSTCKRHLPTAQVFKIKSLLNCEDFSGLFYIVGFAPDLQIRFKMTTVSLLFHWFSYMLYSTYYAAYN